MRTKISWLVGAFVTCLVWMNATQCTTGDPRLQQYKVEGEQLYLTHCANCHQADGKGLRRVYPPIASSDFLNGNLDKVVCAMKYGMEGEITVNGVKYNQAMPGIPSLTELELAEIATYVYNNWGRQEGLIEVNRMASLLDSCKAASLRDR